MEQVSRSYDRSLSGGPDVTEAEGWGECRSRWSQREKRASSCAGLCRPEWGFAWDAMLLEILSSGMAGPEFSFTVDSTANACILEPNTKKYISFHLKCNQRASRVVWIWQRWGCLKKGYTNFSWMRHFLYYFQCAPSKLKALSQGIQH